MKIDLSDILDQPVDVPITHQGKPVPNQFPKITNVPYRIAIVGEAPGADEEKQGLPFVGASGQFLNKLLAKANILRDACFVGNVCQIRPPDNDISNFAYEGKEIQEGLTQLRKDLAEYKPNICLLLGKTALYAFHQTNAISDWRGSFFISPTFGYKCIASYHPAACLRQYEWTPLLTFDIKKMLDEARTNTLALPERQLDTSGNLTYILNELTKIKTEKPTIALDIEGYVGAMSCLSIARNSNECFIIPFSTRDGRSFWSNPDDECLVWRALSSVLADPLIPKVLQNSLYDRFVLQYSYHLVIKGVVDDTMLKHWELYCELEKSLGFQCSIYTKQPYYKSDRKSDDRETFWRYCCMDSAVTWEINDRLTQWLSGNELSHYKFNLDLLNPILYMENRGIKYNTELAEQRYEQIQKQIYELQVRIDSISKRGIPEGTTRPHLEGLIRSTMCYKRNDSQPKKGFVETLPKAIDLLNKWPDVSESDRGFLSTVLGLSLNTKGDQLKNYLYEELKLPKQYATDPQTKEKRLSVNYESLLKLTKVSNHPILELALDIGELRTRAQMLSIHADPDGRIRAGYNIVGTETGRLTCYTSPTGSGYNLQTIPSKNKLKPEGHPLRNGMRDLFVADEGYLLFQCDLAGADGWTIGANLAALGDRSMLDDLHARIKPAARICYMLRHGNESLKGKSRQEVKELLKEVKGEDWDYFACKQGIWGTCYLMGPDKLSTVILIQSEGKVNMSRSDVREFQTAVFTAYNVKLLHAAMKIKLERQPYPPRITGPSGQTRKFFGRQQEILGQALAHEPQVTTTYATNLAAHKLWIDPENRDGRNLIIQPLHQVHDALIGMFPTTKKEWAIERIKTYFDNEILIAGIKVKIPFEMGIGTSWGNLETVI